MSNPVVLNYGDTIIRLSELQSLDSNSWLTDNIISFFFEYMSNNTFAAYGSRLALVGPDFTQLLKLCDKNELLTLINSADLNNKEFVIFPVNDSMSYDSPGGSHWSLLVCNFRSKWCRHYDSLAGMNDTNARELVKRLMVLSDDESLVFETMQCPQQSNGYDCGVHVIANARILAEHYLTDGLLKWLAHSQYSSMRKRLKSVIIHVNDCLDIMP